MSEQNEPEVGVEPEAEPEAEEGILHRLMDEVKEGFEELGEKLKDGAEFIEDKVEDLVDKVKGQDD